MMKAELRVDSSIINQKFLVRYPWNTSKIREVIAKRIDILDGTKYIVFKLSSGQEFSYTEDVFSNCLYSAGCVSYDTEGYYFEMYNPTPPEMTKVERTREILQEIRDKQEELLKLYDILDPRDFISDEWKELENKSLRYAEESAQISEISPVKRESHDHPAYYGGEDNVYEVIKIIEHYGLSFCAGNALKYLIRAGRKEESDEIHDLKKGVWYFKREIDNRRKARNENKISNV